MTARLSDAEARALGLTPPKPRRTTRKTAPGPYHTVCHDCGEHFTTRASEDRHVSRGHARYDCVFEVAEP